MHFNFWELINENKNPQNFLYLMSKKKKWRFEEEM